MGSNRQLRRAEERRLRKQNRKAGAMGDVTPALTVPANLLDEEGDTLLASLEISSTADAPELKTSVSEKQLSTNRHNAQLSTGPRTAEGKARSSRNALKHGLTSQTIILSAQDAPRYAAMCDRFKADWKPVGDRELELTQMLVDTQWRLNRVPRLEAALYAAARLEFPDLHADQDPELQDALLEIHTQQVYERQFRNLHIQESRLRRYYANTVKELTELQERRRVEDHKRAHAAKLAAQAQPSGGFVFSSPHSVQPAAAIPPANPHRSDSSGGSPTRNL
jgi:hypothetical protein